MAKKKEKKSTDLRGKVIDKKSKFYGKTFDLMEDPEGYRTKLAVYHGHDVIFLKKQIKLL